MEVKRKEFMKRFLEFIQDQGVVGIAIAFVLGAAVTRLITSFINNLINPILSWVLGVTGGITHATFRIGTVVFSYGSFISALIDFAVVLVIVYAFYRLLRLEKLVKKKEK
jgi:large conductance mechanosensitive channel